MRGKRKSHGFSWENYLQSLCFSTLTLVYPRICRIYMGYWRLAKIRILEFQTLFILQYFPQEMWNMWPCLKIVHPHIWGLINCDLFITMTSFGCTYIQIWNGLIMFDCILSQYALTITILSPMFVASMLQIPDGCWFNHLGNLGTAQ